MSDLILLFWLLVVPYCVTFLVAWWYDKRNP